MLCYNNKFVGRFLYSLALSRSEKYSGGLCISLYLTNMTNWIEGTLYPSTTLIGSWSFTFALPRPAHHCYTRQWSYVAHNDVREDVNLVPEGMRHILRKYTALSLEKNIVRIKTEYRP